jgi:hypothetical protein
LSPQTKPYYLNLYKLFLKIGKIRKIELFSYALLSFGKGIGLFNNSSAELTTTDIQPASARITAKTGLRIPNPAKLRATKFQMNA